MNRTISIQRNIPFELSMTPEDQKAWDLVLEKTPREAFTQALERIRQNPAFSNQIRHYQEYFRRQLAATENEPNALIETSFMNIRTSQDDKRYMFNLREPARGMIVLDSFVILNLAAVIGQFLIHPAQTKGLKIFNISTMSIIGCYFFTSLVLLSTKLTRPNSWPYNIKTIGAFAVITLSGLVSSILNGSFVLRDIEHNRTLQATNSTTNNVTHGSINSSLANTSNQPQANEPSWLAIGSVFMAVAHFFLYCPLFCVAISAKPRRYYLPRQLVAHPQFEQTFREITHRMQIVRMIGLSHQNDGTGGGGDGG